MKITYSETDKFVLSSSCKIVKGVKRSVLIDYLRTDVRVISNDYADLIEMLDRKTIYFVKDIVGENSEEQFNTFLEFMVLNEFGFITEDISLFPKMSQEINDDHLALIDTIIEVDERLMDSAEFQDVLQKIDALNCAHLQLRVQSKASEEFLLGVMNQVMETRIPYIEIHISESNLNLRFYEKLIIDYATLSNVYVYNQKSSDTFPVNLEKDDYYPLLMGHIHFIEESLSESCCGVINFKNLSFKDVNSHNMIKQFNGCLYKKLTIDVKGNIKNCPSINKNFGHHSQKDLSLILNDHKFKSLGLIKKDDIKICQDCEFRYNCTDCRAFTIDKNDIYSKPLKCGYNPYTNEWDEWSTSSLRKYDVVN